MPGSLFGDLSSSSRRHHAALAGPPSQSLRQTLCAAVQTAARGTLGYKTWVRHVSGVQSLLAALARRREDLAWCLSGASNAQPSSALANTPREADHLVSA